MSIAPVDEQESKLYRPANTPLLPFSSSSFFFVRLSKVIRSDIDILRMDLKRIARSLNASFSSRRGDSGSCHYSRIDAFQLLTLAQTPQYPLPVINRVDMQPSRGNPSNCNPLR